MKTTQIENEFHANRVVSIKSKIDILVEEVDEMKDRLETLNSNLNFHKSKIEKA